MSPEELARLEHLKNIDITAWQYRTGDWFTIQLFDLMVKADSNNFALLASVFPLEAEAFGWWRSGAWSRKEGR